MDSEQRYAQTFNKVWQDIYFACIHNIITCLLCAYQPSLVKKYILQRHYMCKHSQEYSKYVDEEKLNLIEGLKLVYQEGCSSSSHLDNVTPSVKALTASYAIFNLIAKNSKPYCEGKFIKECLIAAVESFGNSLTLDEVASIPLSDKTVKSRIDDISSSLEKKLKSFYSLALFFRCVLMRAPIIDM